MSGIDAERTDADNPEWTDEDFARSKPASMLPADVLAAFPNTARQMTGQPKVRVSIDLSEDVVRFFKGRSSDWQSDIDDVLKKAIAG